LASIYELADRPHFEIIGEKIPQNNPVILSGGSMDSNSI
jgi:hypothetical protein